MSDRGSGLALFRANVTRGSDDLTFAGDTQVRIGDLLGQAEVGHLYLTILTEE